MKKPVLVAILIVAAILGIIIYSMLGLSAYRVEVCIQFKGVTTCKIARGASLESAIRQATDNACGEMASGVTDVMACTRSEPVKINNLQ